MHTPGPYYQSPPHADGKQSAYVFGRGGAYVGLMNDAETAARVTACLNGCQGIADPAAVGELLEALQTLCNIWAGSDQASNPDEDQYEPAFALARAAIARATASESKSGKDL